MRPSIVGAAIWHRRDYGALPPIGPISRYMATGIPNALHRHLDALRHPASAQTMMEYANAPFPACAFVLSGGVPRANLRGPGAAEAGRRLPRRGPITHIGRLPRYGARIKKTDRHFPRAGRLSGSVSREIYGGYGRNPSHATRRAPAMGGRAAHWRRDFRAFFRPYGGRCSPVNRQFKLPIFLPR